MDLDEMVDNLSDNIKFLEARITDVENNFLDLSEKMLRYQEKVEHFEEKQKKKAKSEINSKLLLEEAKNDFLESKPDSRNDPFTDFELVFWGSYVLRGTPRQERLTAFSEVAKRAKKIREMISFFKEKYTANIDNEKGKDSHARQLVKMFLKYFLTNFEFVGDGKNKKLNNFWIATSDWALNNYSRNIELYNQINLLPDESLD